MSFLQILRARFERTEGKNGDFVPWELDDKYKAYQFVVAAGYEPPKYARCSSVSEAVQIGLTYGQRFLVKQPNRHSGKGIYLLESMGGGKFIDLLTLKEIIPENIKADGPEPDYWLAEECLQSEIDGKSIPFDYKIYCFFGRPTVIIQIDRNVSPPRVALFDGAFLPLETGTHYETDPRRWMAGNHVIPSHAPQLLKMARDLAERTECRFVSVDCYCTPDGPRFGEFTFAPGAPDAKMIVFSDLLLEELDKAIAGDKINNLVGINIDAAKLYQAASSNGVAFSIDNVLHFKYISASGSAGDARYGNLLTSFAAKNALQHHFQLAARMVGLLNGDKNQLFFIWSAINSRRGFVSGAERIREFEQLALEFHRSKAEGNPWHTSRVAEIGLGSNEVKAIEVLERLSAEGYKHATNVLTGYRQRYGAR